MEKLVSSSASKTCSLDPMPTKLIKDNSDVMVPVLKDIINGSLAAGSVPASMKKALVTPLLKKDNLDVKILKNYRPVSNLSFTSKLVEKAVAGQLNAHLKLNNLHEPMQSAYRPGHSVESALIRIHNAILRAMDKQQRVFLILLDLSAAFDTLDHGILLDRLKHRIGVKDTALDWFASYLAGRGQSIHINGTSSAETNLKYGVPQGSVLGPLLFTIYTSPIGEIIRRHGLDYCLYADDTQLYLAFNVRTPASVEEAIHRVVMCIREIRAWMATNKLKFNDDKSEALMICNQRQRSCVDVTTIEVGTATVSFRKTARNLGTLFDQALDMKSHVNSVCRSGNYHLRTIGRIRHLLPQAVAEQLTHAFVTSRLDSCNGLLYGLPDALIDKLQRVQNAAARLVTRTKKFDHITPVLHQLHWLPIKQRVVFKILLFVYRALHGLAPNYLCDLLTPYSPERSLRSSEKLLLVVPRTRYHSYGDRAFSVAGPKLWSTLPQDIKTAPTIHIFKRHLKTFLFKQSFN